MTAQAQTKPKSVLLQPFHRSQSDRLLESTKDSPNKVWLDVPEQLQISNYSFIQDENGNRRATRYYQGCRTIFLDEQLKQAKDNQEPLRVLQLKDTIFIKNGATLFVDVEPFKTLFQFVMTHNDNTSNPNRVVPQSGEDYTAFMVEDNQGKASKEIDEAENLELAYQILNKTKIGIGATREFNEGELGKLALMFGINQPSNEETYNMLRKVAQFSPGQFVGLVNKIQLMVIRHVDEAKKEGIVTYKEGEYFINEELVYASSDKNVKKHDAEFINYLGSPEGTPTYQNLQLAIENKHFSSK